MDMLGLAFLKIGLFMVAVRVMPGDDWFPKFWAGVLIIVTTSLPNRLP